MTTRDIQFPTSLPERHLILDSLRGIALLGICLANFPEFALYTFQNSEVTASMPTAGIDRIIRYIQYIFIDGKFYSIFSLLFGIGFSIMMSNALEKGRNGIAVFYRRIIILGIIGLLHLLLLWSGDILLLYALIALILPLFRNVSNTKLLIISILLIFCPVLMDIIQAISGNYFNLVASITKIIEYLDSLSGITENNFGTWLVEKKSYVNVLEFTLSGAFRRTQELVESNRVFKVLGLFLLGLYIGRKQIYANLHDNINLLKSIRLYGFMLGFPSSCLYAWNSINGHPLGIIGSSTVYAISVVPLSLAYVSTLCLWYTNQRLPNIFKVVAAPGRMALTNYIGQSIAGIVIFYGIGFELGAKTGLVYAELAALGVYLFLLISSCVWLKFFRFGPLEWIWRMLTYGCFFKLSK